MQQTTEAPIALERDRRTIFQTAFEDFDKTGNWPALHVLARRLVQDVDAHQALEGLTGPWASVESLGNDSIMCLRPPAIAQCAGSEEVADAFLKTLQFAVTKYFGADPTPEFTQQILVAELGLSNLRAHQAMQIYKGENLWSSVNGHVPGNWIIKVDNHVRPFRDVKTIQEYIERKYPGELAAHPLSGQKPFRPMVLASAPPLVFLSHSGSDAIVDGLRLTLGHVFGPAATIWSASDLPGGRWDDNIREQLKKASALLLAATPSVLSSVYVGFEAGYVDARLGQRNVFILRLGVQVNQLQTRPPLSHFQSFDPPWRPSQSTPDPPTIVAFPILRPYN